MIQVRASKDRGFVDMGWLKSHHTFSFGHYHDPEQMGFRDLRVINEDYVEGGQGFGAHPHRDMEIITYVLAGSLEHKDSMGNGSTIQANDVQYMSAGSGVTHSEFNPSAADTVHLLQIWIFPNAEGLKPRYDQRRFEPAQKLNRLQLLASLGGKDGSIDLRQDVNLYAAILKPEKKISIDLQSGRGAWIQVIRGDLQVNEQKLAAGDGAAVTDETNLRFAARSESEFLLFDLN